MTIQKKKILIADDEVSILDMYSQGLAMAEYDVIQAKNGKEVLEALEVNKNVDLILLDIIMPKMDGLDTLAQIKKDDKTKNIPVVMLSNLNMESDITEAERLGASGFLVKVKTSVRELIIKVNDILKSTK